MDTVLYDANSNGSLLCCSFNSDPNLVGGVGARDNLHVIGGCHDVGGGEVYWTAPWLFACWGWRHWHPVPHPGLDLWQGSFTDAVGFWDFNLGCPAVMLKFVPNGEGFISLIRATFPTSMQLIDLPIVPPADGYRKVLYPGPTIMDTGSGLLEPTPSE